MSQADNEPISYQIYPFATDAISARDTSAASSNMADVCVCFLKLWLLLFYGGLGQCFSTLPRLLLVPAASTSSATK